MWITSTRACLAALLVGLLASGRANAQDQTKPGLPVSDPLKAEVVALLGRPDDLAFPTRQRRDALLAYYHNPQSRVLWEDRALSQAFLERLSRAHEDGLVSNPGLIKELLARRGIDRFGMSVKAQRERAARAELYWSAIFLKYAAELKVGRVLPTKVDTKLFWQEKRIDETAALELVSALGNAEAFFAAWQPQIPTYLALRKALIEYQALERTGGWPSVPVGELLKPGMTSPVIPALRARLAVTDGAPAAPPLSPATPAPTIVADNSRSSIAPADPSTRYTSDLVAAVKRFQARHGLDPDGIVGKKTYLQLNIPIADRVRQIVLSMERLRWMPEDLGDHYIKVNIAGFELRRVEGRRVREVMRVVVGKPYHQTPVFSKTMEYVEINPYWNVPRSIAINEELAKLKADPGARAAKGFEAVVNDKPVPLTSIDWSGFSKNNFPIRIRQRPGPSNALGRVKFMFPNRFNVYMHDTPARTLFAEASRAYSHGCIRLARPIDMTEQVLAKVPGWTRQRIEDVLASGERTVVSLKQPIDVHITYSTAWRDEDGDVQFRPDIYRRDAKLYAALFGRAYPY